MLLSLCLLMVPLRAGSLIGLLPENNQVKGWQPRGSAELYDTATIWDKINGGAVPYVDNGMIAAAYRDFTNGGDVISLACFDQGTIQGAAGVLTALVPEDASALAGIGDQARLDASPLYNYIVHFRCRRYYCTLTGPKDAAGLDALKEFARVIDSKINQATFK